MANYTATEIKALRERTGAGMLDVKKALDEADGDLQKAQEIIRVKGLKGVTKREGRATAEGLVAARVEGTVGYMVEVNSETDFVAKSAPFVEFGNKVLDAAVAADATTLESLMDAQVDGKAVSELVTETVRLAGYRLSYTRPAGAGQGRLHAVGGVALPADAVEVPGGGPVPGSSAWTCWAPRRPPAGPTASSAPTAPSRRASS